MFGFQKKDAVAESHAGQASYATQDHAPVSAPPARLEPDWTQMGAFHHTPGHAFEAVATASGIDLNAPRPITPAVAPSGNAEPVPAVETVQVILPTLYYPQRVRSGQVVEADGDLVVLGDVSNGAEVRAGGNVHILGTCAGKVYAGEARGGRPANPDAKVFLLHCKAEIISLGTHFTCFEVMPPNLAGRAVLFSMTGSKMEIYPLA